MLAVSSGMLGVCLLLSSQVERTLVMNWRDELVDFCLLWELQYT